MDKICDYKLCHDIFFMIKFNEYEKLTSIINELNYDKFSHIINKLWYSIGKCNDTGNIFHYACLFSYAHIIKLLVENGADYNMKTRLGNTGIHLIVQSTVGKISSIDYLLTLDNIDIHSTNKSGESPVTSAKKDSPYISEVFNKYITNNVKIVLDLYLCDDLIRIITKIII